MIFLGPPRDRDDALVLRPQFSIGDRVEYRSDTHRQWLPGTVSEAQIAGQTVHLLYVMQSVSHLRCSLIFLEVQAEEMWLLLPDID